jgi:hypothetical protein
MTHTDDAILTEREAAVLGPLAEHRLLIVPQVAVLLGLSERTAVNRLKALKQSGLVAFGPIFQGLPWAASIESDGRRALGSTLKAPQLNLNEYRHDVGVGWLWLAARAGSLGKLRGLTTERRMQADDAGQLAAGQDSRWGVGLGLLGSHGQPQRHYPDLMLEMASGHRVAVELELTAKSARRVSRIMTAYASDARVDHVLYLAANGSIAARMRQAARNAGIPERVQVQLLAPDGIAGAEIGRMRGAGRRHAPERARVLGRSRPAERGAER